MFPFEYHGGIALRAVFQTSWASCALAVLIIRRNGFR